MSSSFLKSLWGLLLFVSASAGTLAGILTLVVHTEMNTGIIGAAETIGILFLLLAPGYLGIQMLKAAREFFKDAQSAIKRKDLKSIALRLN